MFKDRANFPLNFSQNPLRPGPRDVNCATQQDPLKTALDGLMRTEGASGKLIPEKAICMFNIVTLLWDLPIEGPKLLSFQRARDTANMVNCYEDNCQCLRSKTMCFVDKSNNRETRKWPMQSDQINKYQR